MQSVGGIFDTRGQALEAIRKLRSIGVGKQSLVVLMPGGDKGEFESELDLMHDSAGPGAWSAMGVGMGSFAGAALISAVLPGLGTVVALGALAAAFIAGGIAGRFAGDLIEHSWVHDDVGDDFHLFEDSLRRSKAIVIVLVDSKIDPKSVSEVLSASGAVSMDQARANWWRAWRANEEKYYDSLGHGKRFAQVEAPYRRGFESGFDPRYRGRKFEAVAVKLRTRFHDSEEEAFRRGFERAQELDWEMQREELEAPRPAS